MPLGAFKAALMGTAGTATTGDVVLLSTQTADGDASLTLTEENEGIVLFTDGINYFIK